MTTRDDRFPDMHSSAQFDAAIEQALRGDAVGDDVATFARFVDDMRVMADRQPPPPSPELAALLGGSAGTREAVASVVPSPPLDRSRLHERSTQPTSRRSRPSWVRLRVVAVPVATKAAAFLAVATTAAAGAAAGMLPEPATQFVRRAIEVVTPFELPGDDVARPGHTDGHVDITGSTHGDGAGDTGTPPTGTPPVAIASDAAVAQDQDVGTDDPRSVPNPNSQASWADTDSEPGASAWPPKAARPASSPPPDDGPTKPAPPHAGLPTGPGSKTGHVPPGHAPPGTPHPGGSGSSDAPLTDHEPTRDRPGRPAGNGPQPAPLGGSSSNHARERPPHGPTPGVGAGPSSSGEALPSGPRPAAANDRSADTDRDHGHRDQPRADESRPVDYGPRTPHNADRGPGGSMGSTQAIDASGLQPPPR
jgi:hypothetical protein